MAADIQFNADAAFAKLGELVARHGPHAIDMASEVVRVNAIGNLVVAAAQALVVGILLVTLTVPLLKRAIEEQSLCIEQREAWVRATTGAVNYPSEPVALWAASASATVATVIFGWAALDTLLDVWTWVALVNPQLALAHDVFAKFTTT